MTMVRQATNDVAGTNGIRDVVFDFCGVLLELNYRACLEGHFPQETVDTLCADEKDVYGFFAAEGRMDAGEDFTDVIEDYRNRYGDDMAAMFSFYIDHYDDALPKMVDGMEQLLIDLRKASCRVWGLTNWSDETFHFAFEKFPQLKRLLQGTVVSGTEKMHKPNADIFNLTLNRFGLEAEHTAFVDDTQANVDGASNVGITGIRFISAPETRNELRRLGVRI
ncbi:HAD superfamily hydrolase (TIGR01509 family) [Bifidobacterium commune]|uniref:Haloacid dehalogenase superfamily, subfamily IA, variant 3 with third motif having DD or ED n=1 Tax=Bifidobacterium commune TaxID=1505727 RepID=A0A1C4H1U0_9BIFI|nr:HAD family phosphatase [Bifidobacterium commune]MBB2954853.1 HAD superfamily hydrolase (TIGR01509 family) [Bifidobacterium commune]SCC78917.1 haloacid dehalogenase superfamily, subfamily IA, variant 3 with third motif having DD or ED [Bifidobacterium commune]